MHITKRLLLGATAGLVAPPGFALEIDPHVPPQIDIGGRVIATTDFSRVQDADRDWDSDERLRFKDSSLLFGFSKYLYDDAGYGFADFGLKVVDEDSELTDDIFPHHIFGGVGWRNFEVGLGRTELPNALLRFPTLRDDDLLRFTHVPNAFSHADHAEEAELYGGQARVTGFVPEWGLSLTLTAAARAETRPDGSRDTFTNFNSGAVGIAYSVPPDMVFTRGLRFAGVTVDGQNIQGVEDSWIYSVIGSVSAVLNNDPEGPLVLDLQGIYNVGTEVEGLQARIDRARAESTAVVAAARYRHMPHLQTRWQAALVTAWHDYRDFGDARSWAVAPVFAYRLGQGIEALAQYRYIDRDNGLASDAGLSRRDHRVQLGLSIAFDHTINKTVGQRDSILLLEHDIFHIGPAGRRH